MRLVLFVALYVVLWTVMVGVTSAVMHHFYADTRWEADPDAIGIALIAGIFWPVTLVLVLLFMIMWLPYRATKWALRKYRG